MYHKILIVGNLGGDPEMRYTGDGKAVTNFSVAVNNKWSGKDGQLHEETVWYRVAAWGKTAEACNQYLQKGRQVFVEGRLRADPETGGPRVYQKNDGSSGAAFEVTAQTVKFLGGRGSGGSNSGDFGGGEPAAEADEEIPF